MKAIDFYRITESTLNKMAKARGINDLSCYYQRRDIHPEKYTGHSQIFVQFAFHAQNATFISGIVNFNKNLAFLDKILCHFNPKAFLKKYKFSTREEAVLCLVEDLRYDERKDCGLRWDSEKSQANKKDTIVRRYANSLFDCAEYLNEFTSREKFLKDLTDNYAEGDFKKLIEHFRRKVPHGFSVALTCDFLKEFDEVFMDLPKPDIHIKDTLCALKGYESNYYSGKKKEYECIIDMQELTQEINASLKGRKITVYQLDRMIWLICSAKFYLHDIENSKDIYLKQISG